MKSYIVDLNAPVIARSKKIWIVHPGKDREYFDIFEREGLVFLDFPDLDLSKPAKITDDIIRQRVRYAMAVRASRGFAYDNGLPILLKDFNGAPGTDVSVHLRTVKHLFQRMGEGDLIIVPGRGAQGRVLFGEVAGSFLPQRTTRPSTINYADVPVRQVNWISTSHYKLDLPPYLVKYFEKPPAISEVPRNGITDKFFDFAYEAYISEKASYVSIAAPTYDGRDFLSITPPAQLIALAVSIYKAQESGQSIAGLSYDSIISTYYDDDIFADAQMRFTSPGRYNFKDRDRRLAQFVNAFVALAIAGALTGCNSSVTNSKAPNSPETSEIDRMIASAKRDAGTAVLNKAQDQAKLSKAKIGLSPPAKVG